MNNKIDRKFFRFINTGSTRLVFLIGRYAIKIPRCFIKPDDSFYGRVYGLLNGWINNRHEYIWSKTKLHDYLLPVNVSLLFSFMITMDRVEELTVEEFLNLNKRRL